VAAVSYGLRISSPYFVARLEIEGDGPHGKVTFAAPILRYMHGWQRFEVDAYAGGKRKWKMEARA
jgi:hypothetical protein